MKIDKTTFLMGEFLNFINIYLKTHSYIAMRA